MMTRRLLATTIVCVGMAGGCSDGPSFEYDSQAIGLRQMAVSPVSAGATLAKVMVESGVSPLLVDTGYPLSALHRGVCPAATPEPGTYDGDIDLVGEVSQGDPVRARFHNVTLFDLCPGAVGDENPVGVLGGDLLSNFSVAFSLPRPEGEVAKAASMTLFDSLPAGDSDLAADGYSVLHFTLRGGGATSTDSQASRPSLPASRVVLRACGQPVSFSREDPMQTCAKGEVEAKSSGANLLLMLSTGHGPLVLSTSAWQRLSGETAAPQAGEPPLTSPLVSGPVPAHWVSVSRLALVDQNPGDSNEWPGACAELARARRIEWTTAHLDQSGACFQPCDVSGSKALPAAAYLELGANLTAAVVSDTSELIRGLNQDFPAAPQVDGIIGAGTLAGTSFEVDYVSQPARLVTSCLPGADRQTCWSPARCVGLDKGDQPHSCFGIKDKDRRFAPACAK
jgi:hypothetical protein